MTNKIKEFMEEFSLLQLITLIGGIILVFVGDFNDNSTQLIIGVIFICFSYFEFMSNNIQNNQNYLSQEIKEIQKRLKSKINGGGF